MRYCGGKNRQVKAFGHILDQALLEVDGSFVEPFVGGYNVIPALTNVQKAICGDIHPGLISLYRAVRDGWEPKVLSREQYRQLRLEKDWSRPETALAAFGHSWGGYEWGGYLSGGKISGAEAIRSLLRVQPSMSNVAFVCCDYKDLQIDYPSVIYCDPPYRRVRKELYGSIDHAEFVNWCKKRSKRHAVYVTEYDPVPGWEVVMEMTHTFNMRPTKTGIYQTEYLMKVR